MNKPEKNVRDFMNRCSDIAGKCEADTFSQDVFSCIYQEISSPIEQYLYAALRLVMKVNFLKAEIFPQFKLERYRADFLLRHTMADGKVNQIIVECDSQEFHDRSEPERRYEKMRERQFVKQGYQVMHFTGKEIIDQPITTASEILHCLTQRDSQQECVETVQLWDEDIH